MFSLTTVQHLAEQNPTQKDLQLAVSHIIQEMLEQINISTDGEDDVERFRADFRHLREQSPLPNQSGRSSKHLCLAALAPAQRLKSWELSLQQEKAEQSFHLVCQESRFAGSSARLSAIFPAARPHPLAFPTKEHFVRRQLVTHLHLPIK